VQFFLQTGRGIGRGKRSKFEKSRKEKGERPSGIVKTIIYVTTKVGEGGARGGEWC